jgi:hypothetical protein
MSVYSKIVVALGKMRYRVLMYLFISIILYGIAFIGEVEPLGYLLGSVNLVGYFLIFLFYGPPIYAPINILSQMIVTLGFFIEMFIVCEFIILLKRAIKVK